MGRYRLISWIAVHNDPFEKSYPSGEYVKDDEGKRIPGPTLTVLFHSSSPYRGDISAVHLLYQSSEVNDDDAFKALATAIRDEILGKKKKGLEVHLHPCALEDPTDHEQIAKEVLPLLDMIRRECVDEKLLVHISPGTPAMHAVWVYASESGYIRGDYSLVKSYRKEERSEDSRVVEVSRGFSGLIREIGVDNALSRKDAFDYRKCVSRAYRELLTDIDRKANLRVPIMLLGERGTGKTTLARFIRDTSRFQKPALDDSWPVVACGQFSGELIRSELFGHVKGAFTDAVERVGLLERVDGDTLFLDEVGDLDLETQRLLIRVLEEGRYTPIGSDQVKFSKFRLICATNRPLEELRGKIHRDFWDRISYFTLTVPPLRVAKDDLGVLWKATYESAVRSSEAPNVSAAPKDHHTLVLHTIEQTSLQGNFRDLYRLAFHLIAHRWWEMEVEQLEESWVKAMLPDKAEAGNDRDVWRRELLRGLSGDTQEFKRVFVDHAPVDLKSFVDWVQASCANEVKSLRESTNMTISELVSAPGDQTLRDWLKKLG